MSKAAMNLQDSFLNQVRRENSEVRVLLVNGTLLRGTVKGFDNFTLILNNRNGQHLIYKHAVAQIVTHRPHVRIEDMQDMDTPETGDTETDTSNAGEKAASEKTRSFDKPRGGDRPSSGERTSASGNRPKPAPSDRPRSPRQDRPAKNDRSQGGEASTSSKAKKEGFNTIDLSQVKLGESKES